jgi:hypothetical protein
MASSLTGSARRRWRLVEPCGRFVFRCAAGRWRGGGRAAAGRAGGAQGAGAGMGASSNQAESSSGAADAAEAAMECRRAAAGAVAGAVRRGCSGLRGGRCGHSRRRAAGRLHGSPSASACTAAKWIGRAFAIAQLPLHAYPHLLQEYRAYVPTDSYAKPHHNCVLALPVAAG